MNIVKGNLLDITTGVIIHQVNNKRVMGAGIAKGIRSLYPKHYDDYMKSSMTLSELVTTRITTEPFFGVVGMVTQDGYGSDRRYTDYEAFKRSLIKIAKLYETNPSIKYYMPFNIGCGLAGGDWNIVSELINTYCPFITIIKL